MLVLRPQMSACMADESVEMRLLMDVGGCLKGWVDGLNAGP